MWRCLESGRKTKMRGLEIVYEQSSGDVVRL